MSHPNLVIVSLYTGLNAFIILLLAYNVGHHRDRADALQPGATGDAELIRAIRAHGNTTEYVPTALIMLFVLALFPAPPVLLHALGAALTLGRVLLAIGMNREQHPNAIRFSGNLLTGLVYLGGAYACLYYAMG